MTCRARALRPRWLAVAGIALCLAAAVQLARDARRADAALHRAQTRLVSLERAVQAGDDVATAQLLRRVQLDSQAASRATSGPLWTGASVVPWLGRSLAETAALADATRTITDRVAPPLLATAADLRAVLHGSGARLDLGAVERLTTPLSTALARLTPVVARLDALPRAGVLPAVSRARALLGSRVDALEARLRSAVAASRAAPDLLGAHGPRRYFVAFQNNAESRGTGGLLGAYAIVVADRGRLAVARLGSDLDLAHLPSPRVDLGPDYAALYGHDARVWQNANMSAHFPYAAMLWLDMWHRQTGQQLDGAVATDPVALGYLLAATGPVRLSGGRTVSSGDVVAKTESSSYALYDGQDRARKEYLLTVAHAVLTRLLAPAGIAHAQLLHALARAAGERRLLVYSAHPAQEAALAGTRISGEVPDAAGPFALLVVNNSAGNKIDYYLARSLRYDLGSCRHGLRTSTVTVVLRNDVPAVPLVRFVAGRKDRAGPAGSSSLLVSLYVSEGAGLQRATLDGTRTAVFAGHERGHPVFVLRLEMPRDKARTLVLHLVEPAVDRTPDVPVQPLVRAQVTAVRRGPC